MTLLDLRIAHQLTQEQICKFTGIPYNTYRRYEYGEREPKWNALIALAKLYHMSPGELLDKLIGWEIDLKLQPMEETEKKGITMNMILYNTVIITNEEGYSIWENNHEERPQPILERRSIEKVISDVVDVPSVGDSLSDPFWDRISLKVSMKTYNYDEGICKITVAPFYIVQGSKEDIEFENNINKAGWQFKGIW